MTLWYYADAAQQRTGPLAADELVRRFHQGTIRLDTLVWREGLGEWRPLREFTEELALQQAPAESFPSSFDAGAAAAAGSAFDSPYAPPAATLGADDSLHFGAEIVHAGFWKRVAASTLDGLLMGVVMVVVLGVGAAMLGVGLSSLASEMASGAISVLFILGLYAVPIGLQAVYFTWMHASPHQATLGKLAVGIKVVQSDGRRISTGRSLGRWAAYFFMHLFSCGLTSLASAFMVGLGQRKQGLHDLAADTLVVDRWAFTAHPERQRRELGTVTVVMIVLLGLLMVGYAVMLVAVSVMAGRTA